MLPTYAGYMTALVERLHSLQEGAEEKLLVAKQRSKNYYDKKANPKEIKIGDFVWPQSGPKPHKFENHYSGPYRVIEVWENGNVKIQITGNKSKVVHSNRLRFSHVKSQKLPEN